MNQNYWLHLNKDKNIIYTSIKSTYDDVEVLHKIFPYTINCNIVWLEFMENDLGDYRSVNLRGYNDDDFMGTYTMEGLSQSIEEILELIKSNS